MTTWRERVPLIWAIIRKDLALAPLTWVGILVVSGVLSGLLAPVAIGIATFSSPSFTWNDGSLRGFYALSATLTTLSLGLAFYSVHAAEIHKGTIRSIILYPVDMNDLSIAKLLSSYLLALIVSLLFFFLPLAGFFLLGLLPFAGFLAIHLMSLSMAFVALATGVFLFHILVHVTHRAFISPTSLGGLFMLLAILLTETAVSTIGTSLLILSAGSQDRFPSPDEFAAVNSFAKSISVLSPHHMAGRILGFGFGISAMWPDPQVVVPVAVLVLVFGYLVGRRIYLDVLVR